MTYHLRGEGLAVAALEALQDPVSKSLRTRYRALRVMAHNSGLAATYAFISSRGAKTGSKQAADYEAVRKVIGKRLYELRFMASPDATPRDTMATISGMTPGDYLRASDDLERLLAWLSRLADAYVADTPSAPSDDPSDPHAG